MPRVKSGTVTHKRRKKVLKLAKGYRGAKHLQFKAASTHDMSYSKLMHGLKVAQVDINRKMLADLAVNDQRAFKKLVDTAKDALK